MLDAAINDRDLAVGQVDEAVPSDDAGLALGHEGNLVALRDMLVEGLLAGMLPFGCPRRDVDVLVGVAFCCQPTKSCLE